MKRFAALCLLLAALPAWPDETGAAKQCAAMGDDRARLACYDSLFRTGGAAEAQNAPRAGTAHNGSIADEFGMNESLRAQAAHRPKPDDLPKRVRAKIVSAGQIAGGFYRLSLDNGQVWQTQESRWDISFEAGGSVDIDRGLFGAYRIAPVGKSYFLAAKRVR